MEAHKNAIFAFQFVRPILQTIPQLIQYTVLEIQFSFVKCCLSTVTVGYAKILSIFIPAYESMQAITMVGLDENKTTSKSF